MVCNDLCNSPFFFFFPGRMLNGIRRKDRLAKNIFVSSFPKRTTKSMGNTSLYSMALLSSLPEEVDSQNSRIEIHSGRLSNTSVCLIVPTSVVLVGIEIGDG